MEKQEVRNNYECEKSRRQVRLELQVEAQVF
jgi:hypothetical protein